MTNTLEVTSLSKKRRWLCLAVLSLAMFAVAIDMTVMNIALPYITIDLQPSSDQQLWILDIYSLVLAGFLVPASSLSDRWGRKRMLLAGFLVFGLSRLLVVFTSTALHIIFVRALLGVGGAMIMPTTLSMIRSIFADPKERSVALGVWAAIAGTGMAIGPIIGGMLLEHLSWHITLLVNAPIMIICFISGFFLMPEYKVKNPGTWDVLAAAVAFAGLILLMWSIKHLAAIMSFDVAGLLSLIVGIALLTYFVFRCKNSKHPLLEVSLFKSKTFTAGTIAALGSMFGVGAILFLIAQWLQLVEGSGPMESGIKLIPFAAGSIIGSLAAPYFAGKFRVRNVMCVGLAIAAVGMAMLFPFGSNLSYTPVAISGFLVSSGTGVLALGSALIMLETPLEKAASAAAFDEISYDLGSVLGIAVLGSISSIIYRLGLNTEHLASLGLDQASIDAAMQSFSAAYAVAEQTGVTELLTSGSNSFTESIVATSAIGGLVLLLAAGLLFYLIPKDTDISGTDSSVEETSL